ncbi:ATP-binding cassette domain-containing protein [Lactococcus lactis]|nr:ATP-binding cassette domain-containing protein [Lactococcus lactis]
MVGKNGVGKSTFANALCHFVEASGDILYRGQSIIADSISERAAKLVILCKIQI